VRTLLLVVLAAACSGGAGDSPVPGTGNNTGVDAGPVADAPPPPPRSGQTHHSGWIEAGNGAGYDSFAANAAWFDTIHPQWYTLGSDGVSIKNGKGMDDARVTTAARANNVLLIPMIAGVSGSGPIVNMISSPSKRAEHIANLVALVDQKGYDGINIDYEKVPESDKALFTQFMSELAVAMHAHGKQVGLAVTAIFQAKGSVFDYPGLAAVVDEVDIMGYDFHWSGGPHRGPVAPLSWIKAVVAYVASTGQPQKFILGLPNYGIAGSWYSTDAGCARACRGAIATTSDELAGCSLNWAHLSTEGRSPNCDSGQGRIYFDDLQSLEEKVAEAKAAGLGGVTFWALGDDLPGVFAMVSKYFP
jgi:spore germination protein YaaH